MKIPLAAARFVASGFWSGLVSPKGAGTVGSIAATMAWFGISYLGSAAIVVEIILLVCFLAFGSICVESVLTSGDRQHSDPSWVVIDEWVGAGLALTLVRPSEWWGWLLVFALFRLFDIWKPGPVRRAESLPGAVGVMSDDLIAGALAALVWYLSYLIL